MRAYRAEIWCDGKHCREGYAEGIPHDDHETLPGLAANRLKSLLDAGWVEINGKHYCPKCAKKAKAS